ncbi:hypothetical protein [Mycobacterium sp. DL440]|uniref:hypothetical protein n=1 Tax=Mycobacterium sp. DL440 TaxID=2675523 RepID=UPI00141EBFFB|nr:hypothetical protein [Mycobacterium sp. DL440]
MVRKLTPAHQRNAVSQGIALGLRVLRRSEFDHQKTRVDLAFEHAWRDWPAEYRAHFSQVNSDLSKGKDAFWVLSEATKKKKVTPLYWEWTGPKLVIHQRSDDWDSDNPDDLEHAMQMIGTDVPLHGWVSLATEFLSQLDR